MLVSFLLLLLLSPPSPVFYFFFFFSLEPLLSSTPAFLPLHPLSFTPPTLSWSLALTRLISQLPHQITFHNSVVRYCSRASPHKQHQQTGTAFTPSSKVAPLPSTQLAELSTSRHWPPKPDPNAASCFCSCFLTICASPIASDGLASSF